MTELNKLFEYVHTISCKLNDADYFKSLTKTRKRECVMARYMTCALFMRKIIITCENAGALINRDHATAIHAKKTIKNLTDTDKKIAGKFNLLAQLTFKEFKEYNKSRMIHPVPGLKDLIREELNKSTNINHLRINIRQLLSDYDF